MRNQRHIILCRSENCQNEATTEDLCRYHYLKNWQQLRKIKTKELEVALTRHIKKLAVIQPDDVFSPYSLEEILGAYDFEELLQEIDKAKTSKEEDDIDIDRIIRNIKVDE